jgi:hypothetical protein
MMKDGLYNAAIRLPEGAAAIWAQALRLNYSNHAKQAAGDDRYGRVPLFEEIAFEPSDIVEVLVEAGQPVKAVARFPLEDGRDVVYVLSRPDCGITFVRTLWVNLGSDNHATLDRSKFVC